MEKGLSIVVPCYNEASRGNFEKRINKVNTYIKTLNYPCEVIYVTDGCTDNTLEVLKKNNCKVSGYIINRGKGSALRFGLNLCKYDTALIMDADLSVSLQNIDYFYKMCDDSTIIIGNRLYNKKKRSKIRRFISFCSNICLRSLIGIKVKDSQCGFKMFKIENYNKIKSYIKSRHWLFDMELLLYLEKANVLIYEVPVKWNNNPDSTLQSKEAIKSSIKELLVILREKNKNVKEIKGL